MIIPPATVNKIRTLWESGQDFETISQATGIPVKELTALKRKGKWQRNLGQMTEFAKASSKAVAAADADLVTEIEKGMAHSGANHAKAVFVQTSGALRRLKKLPAIKTWKDVEIADSIARRAAGMDPKNGKGGGTGTIINLGIVAGGYVPRVAATEDGAPIPVEATVVSAED